MQAFTRLLSTAAALAACAGTAHAALIFNGSYNNNPNNNSYIGVYNSNNLDSALFGNPGLGLGAFTNTWIFEFGPGGSATMNANFVPGFPNPNSIQNFSVSLFRATAGGCGGITATLAGSCSSYSQGSLVATGVPGAASSSIPFTGLVAGTYAMVITGTVVSTPTLYSGQMTTSPVPEPTSLALAGLALVGAGVTLRRKRAA